MSFMKEYESEDALVPTTVPPVDEQFAKKHPALWEYLTVDKTPGGTVRERSSIILFIEGTEVKLCLNDNSKGRNLWTTAKTIQEAFRACDLALQAGGAAWRAKKPAGGPGKGKGK